MKQEGPSEDKKSKKEKEKEGQGGIEMEEHRKRAPRKET